MEYFGPSSGIESSNLINVECQDSYLSSEDGDDSDDLMMIGEEVSKSNQGKSIEAIHQEVSDYTFSQPAVKSFGPVSGIESFNCYSSVSHNLINVDIPSIGEHLLPGC